MTSCYQESRTGRLTAELSALFVEGDRLQEEVKKQLGGIGYEL